TRLDPAGGELDVDRLSDGDGPGVPDDGSPGAHDRIAAGERRTRRERLEPHPGPVESGAAALDEEAGRDDELLAAPRQPGAVALEHAAPRGRDALAEALEPRAELVEVGHDEARGRG